MVVLPAPKKAKVLSLHEEASCECEGAMVSTNYMRVYLLNRKGEELS